MKRLTLFATLILVILSGCRSAGSDQAQTVDIAYPDADVVTLNLDTTSGQIAVSGGGSSGVSGTLETNVGDWRAESSSSGNTITIQQGRASADVIPNASNNWNLSLGAGQALRLNHTNRAADTSFSLGGVTLVGLGITATSGDYTLRYDTPNAADDGGEAAIQLGNGSLEATGLLNSHLSSFSLTTQGGDVNMAFDGTSLAQTMNVRIETRSGDVLLKIPANVAAQVIYRTSSGTVLEVDPQYQRDNDITFTVGDLSGDAPRLAIEIRTVIGDLRLAGA